MIYLDNSATTRPFDAALAAANEAAREGFYNPSSLYAQAMIGERLIKGAADAVRGALGYRDGEVLFTSGGTEADNIAILGAAKRLRGRKGHFLYGAAEHPAVSRAMQALAEQGHDVERVAVDGEGVVREQALADRLRPDTALVSIQHVNNEVGSINPIESLCEVARAASPDALFHVDGVQAFLRLAAPAGIDLYALSAHKVHGPRGTGALWMGKRARLLPIVYGGGQQQGLRSGTENTPGAEGLRAAIAAFPPQKEAAERLMALKLRLYRGIGERVADARVNGPDPQQGAAHILNVSFGVKGEVLLHALEGEGILVSTGSACSSRARAPSETLAAMGLAADRIDGAIRFSLCPLNTAEEIDRTVEALARLVPYYRRFSRK